MLKIATIRTFKNMVLLSKCNMPCIFVLNERFLLENTRPIIFLKFSAPPLFQRNCCELGILPAILAAAHTITSTVTATNSVAQKSIATRLRLKRLTSIVLEIYYFHC